LARLTGGDPSLLRRINSAVVLHALRATDAATLTEITRVTGLSRPTVEGVVEGLIEAGYVVEKAADESVARRQGRPARRFRFRAEAGHLLGLDVGVHRVAALLADLDGRVLGAITKDVDETAPADERLERLRTAVDRFIRRLVHDVAALVLALDPELVVIGGWASGLDGVLEPLRRELARYCLRPPKVALSLLGEAAVAMGALRLALDHVEAELFAVEGTATGRR
jgi:predicted NBD/HSP70 family sugar kinase